MATKDPSPTFLSSLATLRISQGRADEAISLYQRAIAINDKRFEENPDNLQVRIDLCLARNNLAMLLAEQPERTEEALAAIEDLINDRFGEEQ